MVPATGRLVGPPVLMKQGGLLTQAASYFIKGLWKIADRTYRLK